MAKQTAQQNAFERQFEQKVLDTIEKHSLFTKHDKVLVACSGGKDSTAILYVLKKYGYDVKAITIDVLIGNYTKQNLENLREFCREIDVKLHEISFREKFGRSLCYIKSVLKTKKINLKSCTICGVLRRYLLNLEARKLKPDFIVTGHNMDDEAQAILMNILRNNLEVSARLGPKTGMMEDEKFVPRVKPLYHCSEDEIIRYSKLKGFDVYYGECPCCADAYRREIREALDSIEKKNHGIKANIIGSFLEMLPKLKESYKTDEKMAYCGRCGEPSRNKLCNSCKIISHIEIN